MPTSLHDIMATLRDFITGELLGRKVDLTESTPLIQGGHLTSLQTVELVGFIEDRFGVVVEPEEVNEQDFHSLRTIAELVSRKAA